jgi:ammonium transporter, Amt family
MAALASGFVVGKRHLLPDEGALPHNLLFVALGVGLLWFGWFGFNGGSALAANSVAAIAFVNTNTAAATGMVAWLALTWWREG